ncbi:MAG: DUF2924 domain-containing protein [Planctomycetota bacterium]
MTKAPSPPNPILLLAEQLRELSVPELVVRYEREWGRPPRVHHACWLRKQIARRVHERQCGGLSKLALARLEELIGEITVFDEPAPPRAPTSRSVRVNASPRMVAGLAVGTILTRSWRDREIRAEITADGVLIDGVTYPSLSAAANAITGQHVSGTRWFGVKRTQRRT